MVTEKDKLCAEYVLSILKTDMVKIMSWGFCQPTLVEDGLRFHVNGLMHQGWVEVNYVESTDDFKVKLLTQDLKEIRCLDTVYFDMLIEIIDSSVEKTINYEQDVQHWLKNQ